MSAVLKKLDGLIDASGGAQALLDQRAAARSAKEFSTSDRLRDELAAMGVAVEDTPGGQRWRRIAEVEHA